MAIVRWNSGTVPTVSRLFDDFFRTEFPDWSRKNFASEGGSLPAVNVKETDDEYRLEVAAPGMSKKDFKVEVDNGVITISAEREVSNESKDDGYTRREFSYESFQRAFSLPDGADDNKISAKYNDGILYISLPKKPEARPQPAKTIKVS